MTTPGTRVGLITSQISNAAFLLQIMNAYDIVRDCCLSDALAQTFNFLTQRLFPNIIPERREQATIAR